MSEATLEQTTAARWQTDPEGYVWDPETGEVHGVIDPRTDLPIWRSDESRALAGLTAEESEPWTIRDEDAANWALKLFMDEEAALQAIEAKRAAILANLDGMAVAHRNRLKSLHWIFGPKLEQYAREALAAMSKGGKTLKLAFGKLAFRSTKGASEILDAPKALAFVEEWAPDRVKKSVGIEAINAAIDLAIEQMGEAQDTSDFFRAAEPRESFTITTGIGK